MAKRHSRKNDPAQRFLFPGLNVNPRGKRRFSEKQKQQMAVLYLSGKTLGAVADAFRASVYGVYYILHRRGIRIRTVAEASRNAIWTEEGRERQRQARQGKRSAAFRRKMSAAAKDRGKSHNWFVDGNGKERDTIRKQEMDRFEYRLWREAVFQRDNFTCQACGKHGGYLHADHIASWHNFPELRYEVSNGRTLCVPCHHKTPSWGRHGKRVKV